MEKLGQKPELQAYCEENDITITTSRGGSVGWHSDIVREAQRLILSVF
jgi:hypothetical protein